MIQALSGKLVLGGLRGSRKIVSAKELSAKEQEAVEDL
jgi:hypothetical protein